MAHPINTRALRYSSFGDPFDILQLEEIELPPLDSDSATLRILAAPINPADFGRVNGSYGHLASLPATGGLEGAAEVVAVGSNVQRFGPGDTVVFSNQPGSWQTYANATENSLQPAPPGLDIEQAAMFSINPATAWRMMRDFVKLEPGDWIIQNAATSAVGKLVIQFAHHLGIKTLNLVRNPSSASHLLQLGATAVIEDTREAAQSIPDLIDLTKAKLGLNAVGGASSLVLAKHLSPEATLVTYGGMDREPARFPTRELIFKDLRLRGFWVSQWYRQSPPSLVASMQEEIAQLMTTAGISTEIAATYPLEEWKTALQHSLQPGKSGKVLFRM